MNGDCFSIVGSRKSLPLSIKIAQDYAKELSNAGFTLVTGIAQGVDEVVLKTALEQSGKVISVLAGGMDNIYPVQNVDLVDKIAKQGLIISEYPPETPVLKHHFPIRNRIIAGLGKGTLIVSGAKRSGTQHTANYAEEYGRDLFAIPYSIGIATGEGCNDLIKRGAMLTDTPEDILGYYGISKEEKQEMNFSEEEKQIIKALKDGEQHVDKICQLVGKKIFEVLPTLSILEIKGVVNKNGVNVFGLARNGLEE